MNEDQKFREPGLPYESPKKHAPHVNTQRVSKHLAQCILLVSCLGVGGKNPKPQALNPGGQGWAVRSLSRDLGLITRATCLVESSGGFQAIL